MLPVFLRALLYLHIAAGFTGFFVAPVALAVRKGGEAHRRWGLAFFWAMMVAGTTSLLLAGLQVLFMPLPAGREVALVFLFITGIFSLYLAAFGYRALYLKKLGQGQRPVWVDWLMVGVGLPVFSFFGYYGLRHDIVPAIVFGLAGVVRTGTQLWSYLRAAPARPVAAQPHFGLHWGVHRGGISLFGHQPALHSLALEFSVAHAAGRAVYAVDAASLRGQRRG